MSTRRSCPPPLARKLETQGQIVYPDSEWKAGDFYDTGQECRRSIVGLFSQKLPDGTTMTSTGNQYIVQRPEKSAVIITYKSASPPCSR
jgi:hypothetical protein